MVYLVLAIFIIAILGLLLSSYKLLFSLLQAISICAMFFFPIKPLSRAQVKSMSTKPLSFWQSPLPYIALLIVLMTYYFNH